MAPTIHLVRHAQGVHNLPGADGSIPDPDLTPLGEEQCARLRASFLSHDRITHLVASPMRRTLYTCIHSFGPSDSDKERREKLYPVTALDLLQEVSEARCDTGSPPEKLVAEFGDRVDVSRVDPQWTDKMNPESKFEPTMAKLVARAREARRALRDIAGKGDDHIVAVSHGGFLHFLTDDWHGIPSDSATGWENCEYRSYQFVDPTGQDDEAALQETPESWRRRQGHQIPPTETEKREIRAAAHESVKPHLKIKA